MRATKSWRDISLLFVAGATPVTLYTAIYNVGTYKFTVLAVAVFVTLIGALSAFIAYLLPIKNIYGSVALSFVIGFVILMSIAGFTIFSIV
jgi:hypothetical protein